MSKDIVRKQFGEHAEAYAASEVHAKGASLSRLVELLALQPAWRVVDIATGAGHTAFALAPHVEHVVASDLTTEMLRVAQSLAVERGLANISFKPADAEDLPFADAEYDLVSCRIAPHHFLHIDSFLQETYRVLKPGGSLAVVDNIVPDGTAGAYVNRFEKLRDPSHHRALGLQEWQDALTSEGFTVKVAETDQKRMEFLPWAQRMGATEATIETLRNMLEYAPEEAAEYFHTESENTVLYFYLTEAIVIGRKS